MGPRGDNFRTRLSTSILLLFIFVFVLFISPEILGGLRTEKVSADKNNQRLHAASLTIQGQVRDGLDNSPVDSIEVSILKDGNEYKTVTDVSGVYSLIFTGVDDENNIAPFRGITSSISSEILRYSSPGASSVTVTFYDITGQEISPSITYNSASNSVKIPLDVTSGVYLCRIENEYEVTLSKYVMLNRQAVAQNELRRIEKSKAGKLSKIALTEKICFKDLREPAKYHTYIDDKVNIDTIKTYDNIAWPIIKLDVPAYGYDGKIEILLGLTHLFAGDGLYSGGALKEPVQVFFNQQDAPKHLVDNVKIANDKSNAHFVGGLAHEVENPYDESDLSHIEVVYHHMSHSDGTTDYYRGSGNQLCANIHINTSRSLTAEEVQSLYLHELNRFWLKGGGANIPIDKSYIACCGRDRPLFFNTAEIKQIEILRKINKLPQNVELGFYKE